MHRLRSVLWLIILFELGVVLLFLPWLPLWESNYFLAHYPVLRPYLLHPSLRGAITGLGALDILLAADLVRRRMRMKTTQTHSA
ncbi:MAG TPA: hypothetical protein VIG89_05105 [Candidatus Acidoferrales bacterium]